MGLKDDILSAAKGTDVESYIVRTMAANPNLTYRYTVGPSKIERNGTTTTLLMNRDFAGNLSALLGSAVHELKHLGTYAAYTSEITAALATKSFDSVLAAVINNEARTTAAAITTADPNVYTSGYITVAQANAALAYAASVAPQGSDSYKAALTSEIASWIRENADVMNEVNKFTVEYLKKTGTNYLLPLAMIPPAEQIRNLNIDMEDYVRDLSGIGITVEFPSGTFDQFGNWFSWDQSFVDLSVKSFTDIVLASFGGAAAGESLTYSVEQAPTGEWDVGLSVQSERLYSPLSERVSEIGKPHGMDSFLAWFQKRTEEMARDVIIYQRGSTDGNDQPIVVDGHAGDAASNSTFDAHEKLQPIESKGTDRTATETYQAANLLISSMSAWSLPSSLDVSSSSFDRYVTGSSGVVAANLTS